MKTGLCISLPAPRLLVQLGKQADPRPGTVSPTMVDISQGLRKTHRRVVRNVKELDPAGLVLVGRYPHCDRRRNLHTLTGVELSWPSPFPGPLGFYVGAAADSPVGGPAARLPDGHPEGSGPTEGQATR